MAIRGTVMYLGMCAEESGAWFRDVARETRTSEIENMLF